MEYEYKLDRVLSETETARRDDALEKIDMFIRENEIDQFGITEDKWGDDSNIFIISVKSGKNAGRYATLCYEFD